MLAKALELEKTHNLLDGGLNEQTVAEIARHIEVEARDCIVAHAHAFTHAEPIQALRMPETAQHACARACVRVRVCLCVCLRGHTGLTAWVSGGVVTEVKEPREVSFQSLAERVRAPGALTMAGDHDGICAPSTAERAVAQYATQWEGSLSAATVTQRRVGWC